MNEDDIQLITSLIGGDLSDTEQQTALARIDAEPELRAAYEQQLAVASLLQATPPATMTAAESDALRATLATELRLGDTTAAVAAAAPSGWSRWWAPLTGLAAAAVIVVALVAVPNLSDDASLEDVGALTAPASTAAPDPLLGASAEESAEEAEEEVTTTAAAEAPATTEAALAEQDVELSSYFVSPEAVRQGELELPVVADVSSLAMVDFRAALGQSLERQSVDSAVLSNCFPSGPEGSELNPVGLTEDGSSVYATTTDPETGDPAVVLINLETCVVSTG